MTSHCHHCQHGDGIITITLSITHTRQAGNLHVGDAGNHFLPSSSRLWQRGRLPVFNTVNNTKITFSRDPRFRLCFESPGTEKGISHGGLVTILMITIPDDDCDSNDDDHDS